MKEPETVW